MANQQNFWKRPWSLLTFRVSVKYENLAIQYLYIANENEPTFRKVKNFISSEGDPVSKEIKSEHFNFYFT